MNYKIFVGFDPKQAEAFRVCEKSINRPVFPLVKENIKEYNRTDIKASTPFSLTRFLVPYLSNYEGWSIFCDSDFLWLCDIDEVFKLRDEDSSVMCVKHEYTPKTNIKMDDKIQYQYPKKNWSSLMLFNNSKCKILTPELINQAQPSYLHRMEWADNIGSLPVEYNWLVGYYKETNLFKPKALHYTDGGPWHKDYKDCEYSDLWINMYNEMHHNHAHVVS